MNPKNITFTLLVAILSSCISEFQPEPDGAYAGILVVDGTITDSISTIRLSQSYGIGDKFTDNIPVTDAIISIETEGGARRTTVSHPFRGAYSIVTGTLHPDSLYRLHIKQNNEEYVSEYLRPIVTPQLERINYQKDQTGKNLNIDVSSTGTESGSRFYRWTYQDIWEFTAELYALGMRDPSADTIMIFDEREGKPNPLFYCWQRGQSSSLILENTLQLNENKIQNKQILSIPIGNKKLSQLYYIEITQYSIRKETYDYFTNLQKNIDEMGSIFAPIPSEMKGNIRGINNDRPAIGFVDVCIPSTQRLFITSSEAGYEAPGKKCDVIDIPMPGYGIYLLDAGGAPTNYAPNRCIDCQLDGGSKNKPDFWPNSHL